MVQRGQRCELVAAAGRGGGGRLSSGMGVRFELVRVSSGKCHVTDTSHYRI